LLADSGWDNAIDSTIGKAFTALANTLVDRKEPGIQHQAIMDFGAVICKPQSPRFVISMSFTKILYRVCW
jgi:adenine-specific DNA glycosylase